MRVRKLITASALPILFGCSGPAVEGVQKSGLVQHPDVPGTIFTIVFENEDKSNVLNPSMPYFDSFAQANGQAAAYVSTTHPSLPNYIELTSGSTHGIISDDDPGYNVRVGGTENLADQLDAAHVPWRAYMESMGSPCNMVSSGTYSAHHNPFLYYTTVATNAARCNEHVVDFDQNFAADLAANQYRYVWITPNMCDDMHDCGGAVVDAWVERVTKQIMASPGYQNGGALFLLFDEGNTRYAGAGANLATVVASPKLVSQGYVSQTAFDHRSYVATIEDIFQMPRLATTKDAAPMDEFFLLAK
jgi:hypothetical protein